MDFQWFSALMRKPLLRLGRESCHLIWVREPPGATVAREVERTRTRPRIVPSLHRPSLPRTTTSPIIPISIVPSVPSEAFPHAPL